MIQGAFWPVREHFWDRKWSCTRHSGIVCQKGIWPKYPRHDKGLPNKNHYCKTPICLVDVVVPQVIGPTGFWAKWWNSIFRLFPHWSFFSLIKFGIILDSEMLMCRWRTAECDPLCGWLNDWWCNLEYRGSLMNCDFMVAVSWPWWSLICFRHWVNPFFQHYGVLHQRSFSFLPGPLDSCKAMFGTGLLLYQPRWIIATGRWDFADPFWDFKPMNCMLKLHLNPSITYHTGIVDQYCMMRQLSMIVSGSLALRCSKHRWAYARMDCAVCNCKVL